MASVDYTAYVIGPRCSMRQHNRGLRRCDKGLGINFNKRILIVALLYICGHFHSRQLSLIFSRSPLMLFCRISGYPSCDVKQS